MRIPEHSCVFSWFDNISSVWTLSLPFPYPLLSSLLGSNKILMSLVTLSHSILTIELYIKSYIVTSSEVRWAIMKNAKKKKMD